MGNRHMEDLGFYNSCKHIYLSWLMTVKGFAMQIIDWGGWKDL